MVNPRPCILHHARLVRARLQRERRENCSWYHPDLSGYCARAAVQVYARMRTLGLEAELWWTNDADDMQPMCHAFTRVDKRWLVDVTASQFNVFTLTRANKLAHPAVVIRPWSRSRDGTIWHNAFRIAPEHIIDYTKLWSATDEKRVTQSDFCYGDEDWSEI